MFENTYAAHPLPDRKILAAFWAAECMTLRTCLRCSSLIPLREYNSSVIALVLKDAAQPGPTHVQGRLDAWMSELVTGAE
jgi:hypothetical protein